MALAVPKRRRVSLGAWTGDRRVWAVAGAAGAVVIVALLAYLAIPREYYTGTNSVTARSIVGELTPGQRLCVRGVTVPAGTGQIRMSAGVNQNPARSVKLDVVGGGRTVSAVHSGTRLSQPGCSGSSTSRSPRFDQDVDDAQVCVTPIGGGMWVGGMVGLQGDSIQPTIDATPYPSRVGVWFMPPPGEKRSLIAQAPTIMERLALFRPGIVGPWTYWLLFFIGLPALALASILLLARASAGLPARVPRPLAIWGIGFACAASFALITPLFETPDEGEHFAAAQYIAETGHANDRTPIANRGPFSTEETYALEAVRLYSLAESPHGRPPWREADEQAWLQRVHAGDPPSRSDGGGFAVATSAHSPLYYALLAPAYRAVGGASVASQLTAMRLMSCAMGALVALFAFLILRELLPRQPWAAVAAGLIVAFQPMFGFISGGINNDNGVNAAAAAITYLIIRGLRRGLTWRLGLALGATLAIAPVLKGTGYFLFPVALLGVIGMLVRGRDRRTLIGLGALLIGGVAVTALWGVVAGVFGRTVVTAPSGNNVTADIIAIHDPVAYVSYIWQLFFPPIPGTDMLNIYAQRVPAFSIYVMRGWGAFGWYAILMPAWVLIGIALVIMGFGALGIIALVRYRRRLRPLAWEVLVLLAVPVCVFLGVEAVYASATPRPGAVAEQGRYIFPAIAALAALAVGACFAFGRRLALPLATVTVVGVIGLSLFGRLIEMAGFYT